MRAKAQASGLNAPLFHKEKHGKIKLCKKGRLEKKAKSGREDFCAEAAYVKVLRAQRWVKSQNVKFRQGNNYRQRQKGLSRHPRHGKRVRAHVLARVS